MSEVVITDGLYEGSIGVVVREAPEVRDERNQPMVVVLVEPGVHVYARKSQVKSQPGPTK